MIKYKSNRLIHVFLKIFDVSLLPKEHHWNYWKFLQVNNICLKTDTILLQYTLYQFQYFIITCLHGWNLSMKVSVKKFSGKWLGGIVQLGLVTFNKLSLVRSLILKCESETDSDFLLKNISLLNVTNPSWTRPSSHFR